MKMRKLKYEIKIRQIQQNSYCVQEIYTAEKKSELPNVIKEITTCKSDEEIKRNLIYIKDLVTKEYFIYV